MRSVLMFLAAVLATLLCADAASAGCRHAGASFNVGGGYYARSSAVVLVRSAPVYAAPVYDTCDVPTDVVPPLAAVRGVDYGYSYASRSFAFRGTNYGYDAALAAQLRAERQLRERLAYEQALGHQRGAGRRGERRAENDNRGSGVVGILAAAARTVGNVGRAVVGGR